MRRSSQSFSDSPDSPDWSAAFRSWLVSRGLASTTANVYAIAIQKSFEDPVAYLRAAPTRGTWKRTRNAWARWSEWRNDPGPWQAIQGIRGPAGPPERQIRVPDPREWLRLGSQAWRIPGPLGAILWVLIYSGLRIGDLIGLTRDQIGEAYRTGHTGSVRQKGRGGGSIRRWTPGPLAAPGVARLAASGEGWEAVYQLLSSTPRAAAQQVARALPAPWHPHAFRHAVITYLVSIRTPLPQIAEITGHSSLSALSRYIDRHIAVPPAQTYTDQARLAAMLLSSANQAGIQGNPAIPPR